MGKIIRVFLLLIAVGALTLCYNDKFIIPYNVANLLHRASLYGFVALGVSFVIITSGIDLSIGAVVGISGTLFFFLISQQNMAVPLAFCCSMTMALCIGLFHGLLITKLRIQPFVVTLCGMMIYRGMSRWIASDQPQGLGDKHPWINWYASGKLAVMNGYQIPVTLIYLIILAVICWIILNQTVIGRYLLAIGRNEQATRYCGIKTDIYVIFAYVTCALMAGFAGILFAIDGGSVQPTSQGANYEVYAIAAAVLGGCSLRGGEGTIIGVVLGAALIPLISNMINLLSIDSSLEFAVIGGVILIGAIVDQTLHYWSGYFKSRKVA